MEKEILERSFKDTKAEERAMAEEHDGQKTVNSNLVEIKSKPCLVWKKYVISESDSFYRFFNFFSTLLQTFLMQYLASPVIHKTDGIWGCLLDGS